MSLPWAVLTEDNLDVAHARMVLDEDHYDLEDVKDRILEFLAVQKLKAEVTSPILCFVGPPGVGKTSLGKSIARAMGRKFIRISVGGVRDESEIRGHRRTYVGAMPGTIIRAIRDAGSSNPVFMIDEIDKMGSDWRGDPSSAMLEVLDPEQHSTFRDHYLDLPFDLSRVMFICTANVLDTIPGPLRDRMEIISIAGYTEQDKMHIARQYLVPRQLERNGLKPNQMTFTDDALTTVIENYTREAGVRGLERQIGTIARKFARMVAEEGRRKMTVDEKQVVKFLGRQKVFRETKRRTSDPGVSTGLAWTPGRRRHPVHRGAGHARQRAARAHRPARRRDEGIGAGGPHLRAQHRRQARRGPGVLQEARHPRARAGRRGAQGRPFGRRGHDRSRWPAWCRGARWTRAWP